MDERFWTVLEALVAGCQVVIDRPVGTAHPRYPAHIYPLDYGYLADTMTADGAGIDVWVGSLGTRQVVGVVCTVDTGKRDTEIKLLLGCTRAEAETVHRVHNQGTQAGLLIWRDSVQEA